MMEIFPKISNQDFCDEMREIIKGKEGIEIQYFDETGPMEDFDLETEAIKKKKEFPNLKEIIIHPPLNNYNIEYLLLKDEKFVENILNRLVDLSEKLDIHISFVSHTYLNDVQFKAIGLVERFRRLLKVLEGKDVTLLLENMFVVLDDRRKCGVLEIAKLVDHPNLRVCIDTTHAHCKANMWKMDFDEMLSNDLNREDCNKYVRQIHFASALENDGYLEKRTHGRKHQSIEDVKEEVEWLKKYDMFYDKNIITEVSEEDYYSRKDQIEEIHMLEKITD